MSSVSSQLDTQHDAKTSQIIEMTTIHKSFDNWSLILSYNMKFNSHFWQHYVYLHISPHLYSSNYVDLHFSEQHPCKIGIHREYHIGNEEARKKNYTFKFISNINYIFKIICNMCSKLFKITQPREPNSVSTSSSSSGFFSVSTCKKK